jgi:deoxyribose-phosphate aldolase
MSMPINRYLDSAVLKPEMTPAEVAAQIQSGIDYDVRSVCVRPADISLALKLCAGTTTDVGRVLCFPLGCGHPRFKAL